MFTPSMMLMYITWSGPHTYASGVITPLFLG